MKNLKYYLIVAAMLLTAGAGFMSCLKGGKLQSITITPATKFIATGTTQQFTATATFSDGTVLNWTSAASWATDHPEVTISNSLGTHGLATSPTGTGIMTKGTFIITATDTVNNVSSTATLSVVDPISIAITPVNPFMAVETTYQFTAIADLASDGTTTITQDLTSSPTISWNSSNEAVASVSSTGLVTAGTTTGSVEITAHSLVSTSTKTGTVTLTVTDTPLDSITISPTDQVISIATTTQQQFTATGNYTDAAMPMRAFTASVIWSSSNNGVAIISNETGSHGISTPVAAGTTTITATDPIIGRSESTSLIVNP